MLLENLNKRRVPRRPLDLVPVDLEMDGRAYHARLSDVSAGGVGLVLRRPGLVHDQFKDEQIQIKIRNQVFNGNVRYELRKERSLILGVSLQDLADEDVQFSNEDPDWDLLENPETLNGIFEGLAYKGPEAPIVIKQTSGRATLIVDKYVAGEYFEGEIFESEMGQIGEGPFRAEFTLYQTFNSFQSKVIALLPKNRVRFTLPKFLARVLRRETVRVRTEASEEIPELIFEEALFKNQDPIKLFDFSEQGCSFLDQDGRFSLPKGYDLGRVGIGLKDGMVVHGKAWIRSYRWMKEEDEYLVGLVFEPDEDSRTSWQNAVLKGRYPSLKFEYENQDHGGIWDLFERSGYLNLKDPGSFSHVFDITKKTWENLAVAGTNISKRALIRKDGQILGHLQMDRIYPKTWCVHHLAIDPSMSRMVGKDLYSLTTDVLSAEGARYVLSLTEASKPWNQRNYYDFVKQYRFPEHHELKLFQVFEFDTRGEHSFEESSKFILRLANEWDQKRIIRFFQLNGTELERDALGLTSEDLNLGKLDQEFSPHGLRRKRDFLVAMQEGKLLGVALLESGTTGVNIFGLLDMCYLYLSPEANPEFKQELIDSLLSSAIEYYRDQEIHDVIIAIPDVDPKCQEKRGLVYIWEGVRWTGKCVAARRYHAYSQMLYGQLQVRREKIRSKHKKNPL